MTAQAYPVSNMPMTAVVDTAFWAQDSASSSPLALHLSPSASSTTQESVNSNTPPAQTPKSENGRNSQSSQGGQNPAGARTSVAVACMPCRNRHLKCDGGVRCSRCRADGVECGYIKSRRGWKGKRKKPGENRAPAVGVPGSPLEPVISTQSSNVSAGPDGNPMLQASLLNTTLLPTSAQSLSPDFAYSPELALSNHLAVAPSSLGVAAAPNGTAQLNLNGTQKLNEFGYLGQPTAFQAFFHYFYNSHPFCLPQPRLLQLFKERRAPLLEFAVQYLGSSYLAEFSTEVYKEALNQTINSGNYARDGFSVQALLLFSIGLHANNEVPRAAQIFQIAQKLTLQLGLNRLDFAIANGNNDRVLEESWRRTWWSMYTVNGMMTAVNPGVQFRLKDVPFNVPLPCENEQYFSGVSISFCLIQTPSGLPKALPRNTPSSQFQHLLQSSFKNFLLFYEH